MWVRELALADFRSYESVDVEFSPGEVVLSGLNGRGKTNLVEAVGYAAGLESHRVSSDSALIRRDCERAVIRLTAVIAGRETTIELQINAGRANKVQVNGSPLPRTRDVLGVFRCVTFAPEDLRLVKGEPSERRRFLDGVMAQVAPRYAGVRSDFEKALKQRNALLRSAAGMSASDFAASVQVWDERYVPLAAELTWGRLNAVRRLTEPVALAYQSISPAADTCRINYVSAIPSLVAATSIEEIHGLIIESLIERRSEEMRRGATSVGPHRDDLDLQLNEMPARTHASHGESWSLALSLRLAAFETLTEIGGEPPILILDDVFAELDETRRGRLLAAISPAEQVFITAAVTADVPTGIVGQRWQVDAGDTSHVELETA